MRQVLGADAFHIRIAPACPGQLPCQRGHDLVASRDDVAHQVR
jgi:hypothetical protein